MANENPTHSTYSKDGNVHSVQAGVPDAPAAQKPAGPQIRHGGVTVYRTHVDEKGEIQVTKTAGARTVSVPTGPSETQAAAINAQGSRVPLALAKDTDVIDLPGYGTSRAAVYLNMGLIRPLVTGGYEMIGAQPAVPQKPNEQKPPVDQKKTEVVPPATKADLAGVQPTSASADAFQESLEAQPALYEQVVTTIAQGKQPDWTELGRMHGEQDEHFAARADAFHGELTNAGATVLRNLGIQDTEAAQRWALANHPEDAANAVRALLSRDVSKIAALGREYVAQRQTRLVTALEAKGVDTFTDHGTTWVSISGLERAVPGLSIPRTRGRGDFSGSSDRVTLAQAIRNGWIEVSE